MDLIYTTILNLLNGLLPSAQLADFQGLNELLAYAMTISLIYLLLLKPILKLIGVIKK